VAILVHSFEPCFRLKKNKTFLIVSRCPSIIVAMLHTSKSAIFMCGFMAMTLTLVSVMLGHSASEPAVRGSLLLQKDTRVSDVRLSPEALQNEMTKNGKVDDTILPVPQAPVSVLQKSLTSSTGADSGKAETYLQRLKTMCKVPIPHGNGFMALLGFFVQKHRTQPDPESAKAPEKLVIAYPITSCFIFKLTQIFIALVLAWLYQQFSFMGKSCSLNGQEEAPAGQEALPTPQSGGDESRTFVHHIFDVSECGRDFTICFCSFCCTNLRWAHTVSQLQLAPKLSFWQAVVLITLLCPVEGAGKVPQLIFSVLSVLFLATVVSYRQELRAKFNIEHHSFRTVFADILAWMCCSCCAAAQEARQLEHGRLMTSV